MSSKPSIIDEAFAHLYLEETRPWGTFRSYDLSEVASIKTITVSPGAKLSLQFHKMRDELWIILDKGLKVTLGTKTWEAQPGEVIHIPCGKAHRVECIAEENAAFFEIWLGENATEEDIVRMSDEYNRS